MKVRSPVSITYGTTNSLWPGTRQLKRILPLTLTAGEYFFADLLAIPAGPGTRCHRAGVQQAGFLIREQLRTT